MLLAHRQIYATAQNIPAKRKGAGKPLEVRIGVVFFGMPEKEPVLGKRLIEDCSGIRW